MGQTLFICSLEALGSTEAWCVKTLTSVGSRKSKVERISWLLYQSIVSNLFTHKPAQYHPTPCIQTVATQRDALVPPNVCTICTMPPVLVDEDNTGGTLRPDLTCQHQSQLLRCQRSQ